MNDLFPNLQQQLNKLSIRKMQFQITKVDFIIDENVYDESLTPPTSEELAENYVGEI